MEEVLTVKVVALKSFSTGTISMFKGEIREMVYLTAETLIDNGLVAEYVPDVPEVGEDDKDKYLHTNAETGAKEWASVASGGGVLVVTDTDGALNKTWQEIADALLVGSVTIVKGDNTILSVGGVNYDDREQAYEVGIAPIGNYQITYAASSADGYPTT